LPANSYRDKPNANIIVRGQARSYGQCFLPVFFAGAFLETVFFFATVFFLVTFLPATFFFTTFFPATVFFLSAAGFFATPFFFGCTFFFTAFLAALRAVLYVRSRCRQQMLSSPSTSCCPISLSCQL